MQDGHEAERPRGVVSKRQSAKTPSSGKRPGTKKARVQFHLGERLVERLGVHSSLSHRNSSAIVEEILSGWLARFGKGRELFPTETDALVQGDESSPAL